MLTEAQTTIWFARLIGYTYEEIKRSSAGWGISLCNHECISSCLRKTALGLPWHPQSQGGAEPYLCPADEKVMVDEILHGAEELASCPTSFISNFAHELKMRRVEMAIASLTQFARCPVLAANLQYPSSPPSKAWLTDFCARHGLRIRCCEKLDSVRRRCCDRRRVMNWFATYHQILRFYDPDLVLNMDETGIASNRKFRVIVPEGMFPVVPDDRREAHLTGIVTFSSGGKLFKPGIIVPGLKNLPQELSALEQACDIYSSKTGWMTKATFRAYCVNLAHQVDLWRLELPERLRHQRVLLLLDGHGSRKSAKAILYLQAHKIDVLVFPGHSTHVLQPFDVGIAAMMKAHLLKEIQKRQRLLAEGKIFATSAIGARRFILASSFLESIQKSVTMWSSRTAFRLCGLCPIDPWVPLASHLILDDASSDHQEDWISGSYFNGLNGAVVFLLQQDGFAFVPVVTARDLLQEAPGALLTRPTPLLVMATQVSV